MTDFPRTQSEIEDALRQQLRDDFGDDIDLTENSIFSTLARVLATVFAQNQEQSLQDVYDSAFIDTATGSDLDAVVALAGIQRRSAINATGVERFSANGPVSADSVIPRGTTVQTDGTDPIVFETTERAVLRYLDGFEQTDTLNEYDGDVGSASIVTTTVYDGLRSLQLDSTAESHVYNADNVLQRGSAHRGHVNVTDGSVAHSTYGIQSLAEYYQVTVDPDSNLLQLSVVEDGTPTVLDQTTVAVPSNTWLAIDHEWNIETDHTITVTDTTTGNTVGTLSGSDSSYVAGPVGFKIDANSTAYFDEFGMQHVGVNIRAVDGGPNGNVGANAITSLPVSIAGISAVTNPFPVGDTDLTNTKAVRFVDGTDAETDAELRSRAKEAVSEGGSATADAIVADLLNNVEGVSSVSLYENKTDTDNTPGGLPPYSFEAVVYGGDSLDIAESIYDNKAVTATDYGGVRGTEVTETVVSDVNAQQWNISFTRPSKIDVDITVELLVDETYVGDTQLKDAVVNYIGGVASDGEETLGLGVGDNVRIDELRDVLVDEENGVVGLDYSVDGDPLSTTPTKTTIDGLEVISIAENEVAQTDATDTSIGIITREY